MNLNTPKTLVCSFLLFALTTVDIRAGYAPSFNQPQSDRSHPIELITADELKAKLTRNEPVTIIDVRATTSYVNSDEKIKGALHVKLRRLRSRLAFPPLKDIPKDRDIVTYCACPSEETSIRAAQIFADAGFKHARALKGGWAAWLKVNGPVEKRPANR